MTVLQQVGELMRHHGRSMTLFAAGENNQFDEQPTRAFLQPLRYKNKIYLEGILSDIGYVDEGHYLYIGPTQPSVHDLPPRSEIHCGGARYFVKRSERVFLADTPVYEWAVLQTLYEGEQPWMV